MHVLQVLYISLHRHEGGRFYPGTGAADEVSICSIVLKFVLPIRWYSTEWENQSCEILIHDNVIIMLLEIAKQKKYYLNSYIA